MPANNNNNDIMVLARSTNQGFIDIPKNAVLVVENKFTKTTKVHSLPGFWFTFPGFCFNTIIYMAPFTKEFSEEKYNVTDMPEVKVVPQVTFKIANPDLFYKQVCGRDVAEIKLVSGRLDGIYTVIKRAIRNIVVSCNFAVLEHFSLNTIINSSGNEVYNKGIIPDSTFQIITQEFTNIQNTYGIKIMNLGFSDVTKPEIVQNAELAAKKAIEDRKAMVEEAEGRRQAAEKDAKAIDTIVKAYITAGVPKEEIGKILMMEKSKGGTVIMGDGTTTNNAMLAQLLQNMNNNSNSNVNPNTNGRTR